MTHVDEAGFYSDVQKRRLANEHFFSLYSENDFAAELSELDRADLRRRYRAAGHAVFWTQSMEALEWMERAFTVRFARGEMSRSEMDFMFQLYLRLRQFEKAASFQALHQVGEPTEIPRIKRSNSTTETGQGVPLWRVDGEIGALVLERRTLPENLIVMTMGLRCGASNRALDRIINDVELKTIFEKHGLLLNGMDSYLDFDDMVDWNTTHPDLEIVLADHFSDWPDKRAWLTPVFHFYRNGKLVDYKLGLTDIDDLRSAVNEFLKNNQG